MPAATTAEIRAWAQANGYAVGDRGRLPAEVSKAFSAATPRPKRRSTTKTTTRRSTPTRRTAPAASSDARRRASTRSPGPRKSAGDATTNMDGILERISALEQQVAELTARLAAADPPRPASARRHRRGLRT